MATQLWLPGISLLNSFCLYPAVFRQHRITTDSSRMGKGAEAAERFVGFWRVVHAL
jgi:hypothetical protein